MRQEVLRMEQVTYSERGITELEDFQLQIYKGEIMGLIPINAYGMNAFLSLLQMNLPIDNGYIYYGNELVNSWKKSKKNHNRISIIKDQSSLVEGLSVADNIFVVRQGFKQRIIRSALLKKQLEPFLRDIGMDISADTYVEKLSVFERVVVEILRAVIMGRQLVVLNEVSTLISEKELYKLHEIIRKYAKQGVAFLYISPHFEEIRMICDRTAILSHGRITKVIQETEMNRDSMNPYTQEYERMVRNYLSRERRKSEERACVLSIEEVTCGSICHMNFKIYAGECVVVQNMDNEVFCDFVSFLTAEKKIESGNIRIDGKNVDILKDYNIAVIQENPTSSMIFPELNYMSNLCMGLSRRMPDIWYNHHIRASIEKEYGAVLGGDVFYMQMDELSQRQKYQLVYARVLLQKPKVVFCIQPFKGTDLPHRMFVWSLLEMLLNKGIAVVILTMNLSDSISLAERLLRVGYGGTLDEVTRDNFGILTSDVPWQYLYNSGN